MTRAIGRRFDVGILQALPRRVDVDQISKPLANELTIKEGEIRRHPKIGLDSKQIFREHAEHST
jgi:hypothetical protein